MAADEFAIRALVVEELRRDTREVSATLRAVTGEVREVKLRHHVVLVRTSLVVDSHGDLSLVKPGDVIEIKSLGRRLCRFHEGPPGDPLRQRWCWRLAVKGSWCSVHASSPLAMYERCVTSRDLGACKTLDALWPGEKYTLYVLSHGMGVKVGLTRSWRFFTRLVEQPHVVAVKLREYDSLVEARKAELSFSRLRGVGEGMGIPRRARLARALGKLAVLEEEAKRLAEVMARLGFTGVYEAYTLIHEGCRVSPGLDEAKPGVYVYRCSWGGTIVLESGGRLYNLSRDKLVHRIIYGRVGR